MVFENLETTRTSFGVFDNRFRRYAPLVMRLLPDDQKRMQELTALLRVARGAFREETHLNFPPDLHRMPDLIEALQNVAGNALAVRRPFWKCVVALDRAQPKLRLVKTILDLFDRVQKVQPGPMVTALLLPRTTKLTTSDASALAILDGLIDPILRDTDGQITAIRTTADTRENVAACAPIIVRDIKSEPLKRFQRFAKSHGGEVTEFFHYAALWEFAYRSLRWRVSFLPALVELIKLGEAFEHEPLYGGLKALLIANFPTTEEIVLSKEKLALVKTRLRVRKWRAKQKGKRRKTLHVTDPSLK